MDAAELVIRITGDIDDIESKLKRTTGAVSSFGDKIERAAERGFGAVERWAKRGALAAGVGVAAITASVVSLGTAYEDSLNVFEVVSDATAAQMEKVADKAIELGDDLTLPATSAAEAADAMTELAKAGLSVEESMDAAKGVLQLAAAAQIEEGQAAEYAASALNAFELAGKDAVKVADLLAGASVAAMGEITDMGDAMKMSAAVFNMAGFTVEDLTTSIAMMAQAGIKGSDAGTSLKQAVLMLIGPTEKAAALINELGIEIYDARGNMKPFRDVIDQVTKATAGMGEEQRNAALKTIFGADAIRAAAVVMTKGVDEFDKMSEAVTKQGIAADVAAARTKGLRGAWDALQSTLETAWIKLYEVVKVPFTEFLLGIGVGVKMLADDPAWKRLEEVIKPFAEGFLGTLERVGLAMQEGGFRAGFEELRRTVQESLGVLDWNVIIDKMLAGLQAARPRLLAMGSFLLDALMDFLRTVDWATVSQQFTTAMVAMVTAVDWAKMAETAVVLLVQVAPQIIDGFVRGIIAAAKNNPLDFVMLLLTLGFLPGKIIAALAGVLRSIPIVGPLAAWFVQGFAAVGRTITAPIRKVLTEAGKASMTGMRSGLRSVWDDIWAWFGNIRGWIAERFSGAGSWLWNVGVDIMRGLLNGMKSMAGSVLGWAANMGKNLLGAIGKVIGWDSPATEFIAMGEDSMKGIMLGVEAYERRLLAQLSALGHATLTAGAISLAPAPSPAAGAAFGSAGIHLDIDYDRLGASIVKAQQAAGDKGVSMTFNTPVDPMHVAREVAWAQGG